MGWKDRSIPVFIDVDQFVRQTPNAVLLKIEGDEYWVGKSQIENIDEVEEDLELPPTERKLDSITVPAWLAIDNGWIDEEEH